MLRLHYAAKPVTLDTKRHYEQDGFKPVGLWYSVETADDGAWRQWCQDKNFRVDALRHTHLLEIDMSRILVLRTASAVRALGKLFPALRLGRDVPDWAWPAWIRIGKKYAGIEIAPYQHTMRLHVDTSWYYSWDVASGCVWDLSAITKFEPVPSKETLSTNT